jgi:hypothetical protein
MFPRSLCSLFFDFTAVGQSLAKVWVTLSDPNLAFFSFWPPAQPFYELLQRATEDRLGPGATHLQCARTPPRRAFEMGDPEFVSAGDHEGD